MVATEPTTSEPTTSVEVLSLNLSVTRVRTWDGEQLMDEKYTVLEDSSETMVIEEGNWVDTEQAVIKYLCQSVTEDTRPPYLISRRSKSS
jgi:hypothetical protein